MEHRDALALFVASQDKCLFAEAVAMAPIVAWQSLYWERLALVPAVSLTIQVASKAVLDQGGQLKIARAHSCIATSWYWVDGNVPKNVLLELDVYKLPLPHRLRAIATMTTKQLGSLHCLLHRYL